MGNDFFEFYSINLKEYYFKNFFKELNNENNNLFNKNDEWIPRGTWLITGGTKGIGLQIAYWLTKEFSSSLKYLILLARNKPNKNDIFWNYFKQMNKYCCVKLKLCNVTDVEIMKEIFEMPEMLQLNGIIHSAGILINAPMAAMESSSLGKVVGPKAEGAFLIDYLLNLYNLNPVHFIINSSLTSLQPNNGQSAYSAANAFCDALIHKRKENGYSGTVLNWGNWLEVGMAASKPGTNELLNSLGFTGLTTKLALYCFKIALKYQPTQLLIGKFDWKKLKENFEDFYKRFEDIEEQKEEKIIKNNKNNFKNIKEEKINLQKLNNSIKQNIPNFEEIITSQVLKQIYSLNEDFKEEGKSINNFVENLNFKSLGFMEMGLDSLRLYQLKSDLNKRLELFGIKINIIDLFERGNIEKLAKYLFERFELDENRKYSKNTFLIKNNLKDINLAFESQNKNISIYCQNHLLFNQPLVPAAFQIEQFINYYLKNLETENNFENKNLLIKEIKFNQKMFLTDWKNSKIIKNKNKIINDYEGFLLKLIVEEKQQNFGEKEKSCFSSCQIISKLFNKELIKNNKKIEINGQTIIFNVKEFYNNIKNKGINYGPKMQFIDEANVFLENKIKNKKIKIKSKMIIDEKQQKWKLIEFGLQTLALCIYQMEKEYFYLPISIDLVKINYLNNFKRIPSNIYCIGEAKLNNNNFIAVGSFNIFDNDKNCLINIEGVIAKRFDENLIKNNYLKENKQNNIPPLFNKEATKFRLFPLSAESKNSLKFFASKLAEYVIKENPNLDQLSNTLLFRLEHYFRFRAFILARNLIELNKELLKIVNNEDIIIENYENNNEEKLAVFFGPQGIQFPGMFLLERQLFPSLNNKIVDICKQIENNETNIDENKNEIFSKNIFSSSPSFIQCSLFAIYQSLWLFLLKICNLKNIKLFFGHSFGEICALCAAGYFNINKGIKLLWKRGKLIEKGTKPAKMLMIRNEIEQNENFQLIHQQVYLSARLSPSISVIVGIPSNIENVANKILKEGKNQKIKSAKILEKINYGYHSNEFMGPIIKDFKFSVEQIFNKNTKWSKQKNVKNVISNLDGNLLNQPLDLAEYLGKQLSEPVRLDLCLKTLLRDFPNIRLLLEIGPSSILPNLINETENEFGIEQNKKIKIIKTMENERKILIGEKEEEPPQLLKAIAQLWQYGFQINFDLLFNSYNNKLDNKLIEFLKELNHSKEEEIFESFKTQIVKTTKLEKENNLFSSSIFLPLKKRTTLYKNKLFLNIFCLHPISGSALLYTNLAKILPKWVNIVGIQFPLEFESFLLNKTFNLVELAKYYAEQIENYLISSKGKEEEKPSLILLGHSLGGVIAREISLIFNQKYFENSSLFLKIPLIIMFDSWAVGQELIYPKKAKEFVLDLFKHFPAHQRNSLSNGAEILAEFLRKHKFNTNNNIEFSPEIWLFTAEKKSKLFFSDYIGDSKDGGWSCLTKKLYLIKCENVDHEGILDLNCLEKYKEILEELCVKVIEF